MTLVRLRALEAVTASLDVSFKLTTQRPPMTSPVPNAIKARSGKP